MWDYLRNRQKTAKVITDSFPRSRVGMRTEPRVSTQEGSHAGAWEPDYVEWKTLGVIFEKITSGKNKEKSNVDPYPVFGSTGIIGRTDKKVYEQRHILVARVGANAGRVNIAQGEFDVSDNTLVFYLKEGISLKYLYYYLVNINLNRFTKGAGQPLLTAGQLKAIKVPVPSSTEQAHNVAILDKFDTLTTSISEGLPREIELRQKQYEYYRDLLLSFPRTTAETALASGEHPHG